MAKRKIARKRNTGVIGPLTAPQICEQTVGAKFRNMLLNFAYLLDQFANPIAKILVAVAALLFIMGMNGCQTLQKTQELLSVAEQLTQAAESDAKEIKKIVRGSAKDIESVVARSVRYHTISKGDTLWDISDLHYVDPFKWLLIYKSNRDIIVNPDLIEVGDTLKILYFYKDEQIRAAKQEAYLYGE